MLNNVVLKVLLIKKEKMSRAEMERVVSFARDKRISLEEACQRLKIEGNWVITKKLEDSFIEPVPKELLEYESFDNPILGVKRWKKF